jgi:hypothetical protein
MQSAQLISKLPIANAERHKDKIRLKYNVYDRTFGNPAAEAALRVDYTVRFQCEFLCPTNRLTQRCAEACDIGGQASATNGLSDIETHIKNALCNRPLNEPMQKVFWNIVTVCQVKT